ncbi:siderophore-interacting protein [Arachnia propionica]|uniref:Siderophore-interacting protein n=1 Tax=Arachnia propionica TaxID=1750 RepID=A0A3P1WNK5_9ACTN|nr:siderophore-interacting protein [Arachnia propionica]RRD48219.1 siderophore-interacting protein [Arachnia propionica]
MMAVTVATVTATQRVSPGFQRITFTTDPTFGGPGPVFDQRIKVVLPGASGPFRPEGSDWFDAWQRVPVEERGAMRTYSIRAMEQSAEATRVVIDFALHESPEGSGPATRWARAARVGDEVTLAGPHRDAPRLGVEFAPGGAERVVLAGDETAAPAIARILEDLPADARGAALIEVDSAADQLPIEAPEGMSVEWLPREGGEHGVRLIPSLLALVPGAAAAGEAGPDPDDIWETPTYSGLGEELAEAAPRSGTYWWIAGEAGVVARLRRALVREHGIERSRVAFMGYWKRGRAME